MNTRFFATTAMLVSLWISLPVFASPPDEQPSVSRRILLCEMWQWIGGSATTWGCLRNPRVAHVAGGEATDQVIAALDKRIDELEARIKKLEHP